MASKTGRRGPGRGAAVRVSVEQLRVVENQLSGLLAELRNVLQEADRHEVKVFSVSCLATSIVGITNLARMISSAKASCLSAVTQRAFPGTASRSLRRQATPQDGAPETEQGNGHQPFQMS